MTVEIIYYRFQYRQGTAADLAAVNEIPLQGETVLETDTRLKKTGDGVTHYNDLPYEGSGLAATLARISLGV